MKTRRRSIPTYEGRPLPRPEEEVVDQGLAFDVGTMIGRRSMLQLFGLGAATVGLTACGASVAGSGSSSSTGAAASATVSASADATTDTDSDTDLAEIPEETAGPYPGDGSNGADVLDTSGVVRSDITASFGGPTGVAEGVPMTLTLSIVDLANGGVPFAGVAVYVWHCNRDGEYSLYANGLTEENYLRGVQIADAAGKVTFTSIFPACYSGRWPHIHFEVYPDEAGISDAANTIATSQVALPQDVCELVYATGGYSTSVSNLEHVSLATDNVFSDDSGATQIPTVSGSVAAGYQLALEVGVDTSTAAGGGGSAGGGGGGGGGAPPAGGGGPGS